MAGGFGSGGGARGVGAWILGGVVLLLVVVAVVFVALQPPLRLDTAPSEPAAPPYAAPAVVPDPAASPTGFAGTADPAWLARVSQSTGIPERALAAYAAAAMIKAQQMPSCGIGWNTLAGIGAVESDHGRHAGSSIQEDGRAVPPIYGISLDGASTSHIPDSDDGAIDGDTEFDRAVGPMQFIPGTWRNWHVDANGDGVEDPQNIDDVTVAAANYLCRASGDMVSPDGWRAGIGAYNASLSYAVSVAAAANDYADAAVAR